jgi:HD superfamily phosphohydrolase
MSRPKFFRDPIHVQIRFAPVDLDQPIPADDHEKRQSWLLRKLIDSPEIQRLRFIRQNGLANVVFHGAEHSRFNHSMGVMYLARQMYRSIVRNMDEAQNPQHALCVTAAALLHDVGHGPFSHALEEILRELKVDFHHEQMTVRFITEDSEINKLLSGIDAALPKEVAAFIDRKFRTEDNWRYKIVSSQLDADRLDYLLRDAYFCGLKGHGFDLARILDLLQHHKGQQIGVDEGALEAVEAYLVALDQLYRAIYYHHAVRAANCLLTSTLKRAITLDRSGDRRVFRWRNHPLKRLAELGHRIEVNEYAILAEHHIWALVDEWTNHQDPALSDLSRRLRRRELFKATEVPMTASLRDIRAYGELVAKAKELTMRTFDHIDENSVDYYVCEDAPERTSYKAYNWKPESSSESIWIMTGRDQGEPIEDVERSAILKGLKQTHHFPRLMMLAEVRELLNRP